MSVEKFSPEYFKPREYSKEAHGRNVHVKIAIERHGNPFKNPETGLSLDSLTEEGLKQEREKGKDLNVPKDGFKAYSSSYRRAMQSDAEQMGGVEDAGKGKKIINKKFSDLKKGKEAAETVYPDQFKVNPITLDEMVQKELAKAKEATPGMSDEDVKKTKEAFSESLKSKHRALVSPYIIREETELTSIHDEFFVKVSKSVKEKEPDPKKQYDALMQAYFDHTGDFGKTLSPRDAGALLAYRVATEMGVTTRLKNGSDVFLKNMTHAPITDALLREVLILKKGAKPGFKNVSEMGGALKPMEGYEFDVRTNTKGEMTVKLLLRGKQYDIDLDKLKDLAKYGKDVLAKVKATATAEKK